MRVKEESKCRICRGELKVVLDLGSIYPSAFLNNNEKVSEDLKAPLVLAECEDCELIQLKHTVDLDLMYRQYWYSSSLNKSMVSSLRDVVSDILGRIILYNNDMIIDIGANDGTMLEMYPRNLWKVAFEPALNVRPKQGSVTTWIPDYFSKEAFDTYLKHPVHTEWAETKAKVITAIAMFYDLPDPHQFVEDVATILHKDGIFVVQFTDLLCMYKATAFDNICHEHLEYYKLADVKFLLEAHGLEVIDVSYNEVNGGSIRIIAAHEGAYPVRESVAKAYNEEKKYMEVYGMKDFQECIGLTKIKVANLLSVAESMDLKVFLLGASTKGNTLLQVCGIDNTKIPYAAEVNKEKFGLRTAGSNIYIIPEEEALSLFPDLFFVPVWHFKDNLLQNEKIRKYIEDGGYLIFPLPVFEMIGKKELDDER
jgi:hypothetical protein